jgi:hypothetical protein
VSGGGTVGRGKHDEEKQREVHSHSQVLLPS